MGAAVACAGRRHSGRAARAAVVSHTYSEASRNSASAATIYLFLSVAPLLLAATGLFHAAGGDANVVARRLIEHQHLTGGTARLLSESFGSASRNALAASVGGIVGFLIWGVAMGADLPRRLRPSLARIEVRTLSDQSRFAISFFVVSGLLGLYFAFAGTVHKSGWVVAVPV